MLNNLLIQYKSIILVILIFSGINLFLFRDALSLSLFTGQPLLFLYYLLQFLIISLVPTLLVVSINKKKFLLLLILVLITVGVWFVEKLPLGQGNKSTPITNSQQTAKQPNPGTQLEVKDIKKQEELKKYNFCFNVQLPNLPNFNYPDPQLGFYEARASVKKCENQLLIMTYNPMTLEIIEIPKSYDFNFRKDYEELKNIQAKALAGEKIPRNGLILYKAPVKMYGDFFISVNNDPGTRNTILYYFEKADALIFVFYEPNEYYSEADVVKAIESMRSL